MWLYLTIGASCIVLGLAIHRYRWYFLIAGYNTMSEQRKAQVDIKSLARLMAIYLYANGGIYVALAILSALGQRTRIIPATIFTVGSTAYLVFAAQKFDRNQVSKAGNVRQAVVKGSAVGMTIVMLAIVAVMLFFASRPTQVSLLEEGLQIHGMYGDMYGWESIEETRLLVEPPTVERRTNGSGVGSHLKGHFRTTEFGAVKLFINIEQPPFVYFKTSRGIVIFNVGDPGETAAIFDQISRSIEAARPRIELGPTSN